MRTTFVALLGLCAASLVIACDDDKKPTETAPSATVSAASAAPTPPPAPKLTPAEAIAKAVKSYAAPYNAHDPTAVAALYEPNAKALQSGFPGAIGRDAIAKNMKDTFGRYSDFKVATTRTFTHGNTVALEWVLTGKNDGGDKPSGLQVGVNGVSVLTYDDDGLIKEQHLYFDTPTLRSQRDPLAKAGTFRAAIALPTAPTENHVSKGTPDEAKVLDTAKGLYAGFEKKGGMDSMAFVTDDSVFDDYTMPASLKGTKAIKDYVTTFWTAFPDMTQTKPIQFAADDYVVTEGTMVGTQKGALGPLKASNKPISFQFVDIFRFKDGKAAHLDTYGNSAEILVAIGAMPPLTPATPAGSGSASPVAAAVPTGAPKPK